MTPRISFCINTAVNERNHIELLFRSLRKNLSRNDHEIIVYVENDNQDTVGFLLSQKSHFPDLKIVKNPLPLPIGYARNINLMFEMATHEIVSYIQSDMVVGPNYDLEIIKFLTPNTIISATRIEPPLHPPSPEKITHDFGLDPTTFNLELFTEFAEKNKKQNTTDFWFAPFTLHKKIWLDIGGHDTLFRRSREDSDLLYRFSMQGLSTKQAWNALVYHFTCTSSRGPEWWTEKAQARTQLQQAADAIEVQRFLRKWPSFKHDSSFNSENEYKYHISANLYETAPRDYDILRIYHLFSRIYIANGETRNALRKLYSTFHAPANELLNISDETWETYKKYYRTWEFDDIFVDTPIITDDVILAVNFHGNSTSTVLRPHTTTIQTLNDIVHANRTEDPGEFELDRLGTLTVNRMENRIRENLIVTNPPLNITFPIL